ncbi:MAG: diguanylate cyclase, partial [Chloroflexi bacterium]|nr:diguanylate cyclase [Chloroflexota bacterium]
MTVAIGARPMLWFATALGVSVAMQAYFAPGLFASPIYAPLAPHLGPFAAVSVVAAVGALVVAEAPLPRRARAAFAACVALMPLVATVNFLLSGRPNGFATWGLLTLALAATGGKAVIGRPVGWRPLRTTAGAMVLLQGLLMVANPQGFLPASYGAFTAWLWLWGPLFGVCGGGLLAAGRLGSSRAVLAFTALVALCLMVLVVTFLGTGVWTGVTIYGLLLVFLRLDEPSGLELRRMPSLLLLVGGALALYHLGAGLLDVMRGPVPAQGLEAHDLWDDLGMAVVAGAWLHRVTRSSSAQVDLATQLAVLAACAGVVAAIVSATSPPHAEIAGTGGRAVGGGLASGILVVGFSVALLADQRWPGRAWLATVLLSIDAVGLSLGLDGVVAGMTELATEAAPALVGGPDAFDAVVLVTLSTAVGIVGVTRALDAPIGGRIFAAFGAVVSVTLMRSLITDVATQDLLALPAGSPQAAAVAARLGATRGLLLLMLVGAAVISGFVITATVTRPLAQLVATLRRYAAGDRTARSEGAGADELGMLARTFDDFAEAQEAAEIRQRSLMSELAEERQQLRSVVETALEAFVAMDAAGRIVDWNGQAEALFGWSRGEIIGRPLAETIVPPTLREQHRRGLRRYLGGGEGPLIGRTQRMPALHRDGHTFPAEISITAIRRGDDRTFSAFIRDMSEQERREAELERLALYDTLTGLPNRTLLRDRFDLAVAAARRDGTAVALGFVDLDQFKSVNEALGHAVGDTLLREAGRRFRAAVRETDTVGRIGGDQFGVVISALAQGSEATEVGRRLLRALERSIEVEARPVYLTASVGLAVVPVAEAAFEETMRQAEVAMYEAKRAGGGELALYSLALDTSPPATFGLSGELRAAIDNGELWVAYQPIVEVRSGRCL